MMNNVERVKQVFDCISSILCAMFGVVIIVLVAYISLQYLGGYTETERELLITEDAIFQDYMMSAGIEYEDTLMLDYSERYDGEIIICDSDELTSDMLENRNGNVIIERCYGKVIDAGTGDGEILNTYDESHNYICYGRCGGIQEGTLMMTYLVYNPATDYTDDIIERYDCVVSHELEG